MVNIIGYFSFVALWLFDILKAVRFPYMTELLAVFDLHYLGF